MKADWRDYLNYDPIAALLSAHNNAIEYFTKRDLLKEKANPVNILWKLKQPQQMFRGQLPNGSWKYPGKNEDYSLLQTFKNLQILVYQYGIDRCHPAAKKACEFLFSFQTKEGDIRGFIGNQYAPYYTGIVTALLINAGYENDPRIEKAFRWLLSMQQDDGGWVIGSPGLLGLPKISREELNYLTSDRSAETAKAFDRSKPFSHSGTGMVIRAFAASRKYRNSPDTLRAAALLKSHLFKEDNYSSYKHPDNWIRFQYPFWWNNLAAALDSLSLIGIPANDPDIKKALDWLSENQRQDGLWNISYSGIHKAPENSKSCEQRLWITLAICRIFQRYFGGESLLI